MQLSLSLSSGKTVGALPQLASALFEAAGKSNDALGASAEEKAEVGKWLERIGSGEFEGEGKLKVSEHDWG